MKTKTTIVLGLGNPILTDDAVGLRVAEELGRLLDDSPLPAVTVRTGTRGGFELIDLLAGYDRAIIVDALTMPEPVPGRIRRLELAAVSGSARLVGGHEIGIQTALRLARELGIPMPALVEIYAVEAMEVLTFSETMTPAVAAAGHALALALHRHLRDAGDLTLATLCADPG